MSHGRRVTGCSSLPGSKGFSQGCSELKLGNSEETGGMNRSPSLAASSLSGQKFRKPTRAHKEPGPLRVKVRDCCQGRQDSMVSTKAQWEEKAKRPKRKI